MRISYLDNAATTRVIDAAANAAMLAMQKCYGNPSSQHALGTEARALLDRSRAQIAHVFGCDAACVTFTSGATESANIAIMSTAYKLRYLGRHIVSSAVEHDATLNTLKHLGGQGFDVTLVEPGPDGVVSAESIMDAVREDTILLCMMAVNNETGAIMPYERAAREFKHRRPEGAVFLDAVQAFSKMPIDLRDVDFAAVTGHKIGAPKGCGALYIAPGWHIAPQMHGGGQERGLRSGTEGMPQIAGFGAASEHRHTNMARNREHSERLRYRLLEGLHAEGIAFELNSPSQGAAHIVNLSPLLGRSEVIMRILGESGIFVSGGSACQKGKRSHVLTAMKKRPENIDAALRISFCPENTEQDVENFCRALKMALSAF